MIHRRLVGMPDDLAGLCKLRVGDWRILYWIYHADKLVRIYRIQPGPKSIVICDLFTPALMSSANSIWWPGDSLQAKCWQLPK